MAAKSYFWWRVLVKIFWHNHIKQSLLSSFIIYSAKIITNFASFRYKDLKDYKAWLGVHNIKGKGEDKHRQVLNISQLVYGPAGSDLVLLKLSRLVAIIANSRFFNWWMRFFLFANSVLHHIWYCIWCVHGVNFQFKKFYLICAEMQVHLP